jgi:hypothetical protein
VETIPIFTQRWRLCLHTYETTHGSLWLSECKAGWEEKNRTHLCYLFALFSLTITFTNPSLVTNLLFILILILIIYFDVLVTYTIYVSFIQHLYDAIDLRYVINYFSLFSLK